MMVMMMARTPSLNTSSRLVGMCPLFQERRWQEGRKPPTRSGVLDSTTRTWAWSSVPSGNDTEISHSPSRRICRRQKPPTAMQRALYAARCVPAAQEQHDRMLDKSSPGAWRLVSARSSRESGQYPGDPFEAQDGQCSLYYLHDESTPTACARRPAAPSTVKPWLAPAATSTAS